MSQFLVLRLTDPVTWVVADAAGMRIGPVAAGTLADAAPLAAGRRVIALAPSTDVVLAEPELPVKSGPRLAQVVPYALEDSLAGDIDQFHFALGRRQNRPGTPTAVVERVKLEGWLAALTAAGLVPEALVPESLCLPDNPGKSVVLIESGRLSVRPPGQLPFALDAEPLTEAFALAGLESEDRYLQVYVAQADWEACRPAVEALREVSGSLDVQLLADGALPLLATTAVTAAPLSLLQGRYAPRTGIRAHWERWRVAAALAAALLVVHSGAAGFHWWQQSREEKRLDAAIEQTFHAAMPDVTRMVDARTQMEQRLRGAGTADPDGLLARLAALGSVVTGVPSTSVESLNWQERALDLKLVAPSTEALAGIARALGERGVAAQVQSTSPRGSAVEGRVVLRAGAAP